MKSKKSKFWRSSAILAIAVSIPANSQVAIAQPRSNSAAAMDSGFFEDQDSVLYSNQPRHLIEPAYMPEIRPAPQAGPTKDQLEREQIIKDGRKRTDERVRNNSKLLELPVRSVPALGANQNHQQMDHNTRKMLGPAQRRIRELTKPNMAPFPWDDSDSDSEESAEP